MIKQIKKFQIKLTPFDATKEWSMSTTNNQDLLLMDDTASLDDEPVALEFIDYGNITSSHPNLNFECDIALEQQPDDLLHTRMGLNVSGLFYPDQDPINQDKTYKRTVFSQVRTMFYNKYHDPTKTWGMDQLDFALGKTKRKLSDEFRLFDFPQQVYGDRVVPNTIIIHDNTLDVEYQITDDGFGNLIAGNNLFSRQQIVSKHDNWYQIGFSSVCDDYFNFTPNTPTNLTVISGSAILNWTSSGRATDYFSIQRSLNGVNYVNYDTASSAVRTYTDRGVTSGNTYYYEVAGVNFYQTGSLSNTASITFSSGSAPTGSGPDPLAWWKMEESGNSDRIDAVNANHLHDFSGPPAPGISQASGKIGFATQFSTTGFGSADMETTTTVGPPDLTSGFHFLMWAAWESWDANTWFYLVNNTIDGPFVNIQAIWQASDNTILVVQDINTPNPSDFTVSFTPTPGQFYFINVFWDASDSKYGIQINNGAITKSPTPITITGTPTDIFVDMLLIWNTNLGNPSTAVVRADEYGIYGKKLSTAQTDFLYNSGNGQTWPFTLPG